MNTESLNNNQNVWNNFNNFPIKIDCLSYIFSFLPYSDILRCSLVSHYWNKASNRKIVWKNQYPKNVLEDFCSLVKEGVITWKEVKLYDQISDFFSRVVSEDQKKISDIVLNQFNLPTLQMNKYINFNTLDMPTPFLRHGEYLFSISNLIDIEMNGKDESIILSGQQGIMLVYLAAEGDYLFALREDGIIIQWDYENQKIINRIETVQTKYYCSNDLMDYLKNQREEENWFYRENCLSIKNGRIALNYQDWKKWNCLEIIPYANPEKSQLIEDSQLKNTKKIKIIKNEIFALGNDYIWILNFKTNKKDSIQFELDPLDFIRDIAIYKHILYAVTFEGKIHVINLKTQQKTLLPIQVIAKQIAVINNLLFLGNSNVNSINILNINNRVFKEFKINLENLKSDTTIKKLVKSAKKYLQPLIIARLQEKENGIKNYFSCCLIL